MSPPAPGRPLPQAPPQTLSPSGGRTDGGGSAVGIGGDTSGPQQPQQQIVASGQEQPAAAMPIAKLPQSKKYSSTARGNMNCSSCRKRKIKCSRTKPSCKSCDVLNVECLYDAVPKKRGPKTEVLEELLKRIDGLEKRLENEKAGKNSIDEGEVSPQAASTVSAGNDNHSSPMNDTCPGEERHGPSPMEERNMVYSPPPTINRYESIGDEPEDYMDAESPDGFPLPPPQTMPSPEMTTITNITANRPEINDPALIAMLVDVYFARVNSRPYSVFHEVTFRRDLNRGRIDSCVLNTVCACSVHLAPGFSPEIAHFYASKFALLGRSLVDADDPTLPYLQSLLLLSLTYYSLGNGKKAFMQMGAAIRMSHALDLHRELPDKHPASRLEREIRRRVFWAAYVMDRFTICGSKRPPTFSDRAISLKMPSTEESFIAGEPQEGIWFSESGNPPLYNQGPGTKNNHALLVDAVRILGKTIRYMQSGGARGDSHFPWHSSSYLSRVRAELNALATAKDMWGSIAPTHDATALFLARIVYHVTHCYLYRSFLPVSLGDLEGSGPQVAWQTEAIKVSFRQATSIVDMVEIADTSPTIEWPAFAGFAMQVAGTVLVHGSFYTHGDAVKDARAGLERVFCKMKMLQQRWVCMRQQFVTLKRMFLAHEKLVKGFAPGRQAATAVFQLEDFFERYQGQYFEPSHIPFFDVSEDEIELTFLGDLSTINTEATQKLVSRQNSTSQAMESTSKLHKNSQFTPTSSSSTVPVTPFSSTYLEDPAPPFFPYSQGPLMDPGYTEGQFTADPYYDNSVQARSDHIQEFANRDPLLSMLAQMAEKDDEPLAHSNSKGDRGLDVWMGNA